MPIYEIRAPNGKIYKFRGPEGAKQEDLFAYVQQQVQAEASAEALRQEQQRQTGILETFGRGVSRGFGRLASTVTDTIPALAGSALGFDEYARQQLEEAKAKEAARQAASPTLYTSFRDIKGPGTALGYAAETIGEQVANILPGVGFGVTGARLGAGAASSAVARSLGERVAQRGLTGEAAETLVRRGTAAAQPAVAQGATRGALGGAFLGSYAQTAPEIFQNISEDSGQLAPAASLLYGSVNAALESILPYKLSQQLTGPMRAGITAKLLEKSGMDQSILRSVTAGALGGVAAEGLTEGAQEAISIAAERFVNENPGVFGSKEWERILESTIRGAVAGGGFGTVGGGVEGIRANIEQKRQAAAELERQGRLEEAQRLQAEVAEAEAQIREIQATDPQMSLPGLEPEPYTQLVTPAAPEPKASKEPKVTQGELFTEQGAPAPAVEAAEVRAEKRAIKQADEDRKAQEKLRRELAKNVGELTNVPTDLVALARGPSPLETLAQQAQTFEGGQAPLPPSEITLAPVITKDAYSKVLGIGRTASIWKAIEGKDLSDPAQAQEVKNVLTAYANGKPAQGAADKIAAFLQDPLFQVAPTTQEAQNVGEPVAGAGGEGAGVAVEPGIDTAPGAAGPVEPTGVEVAGGTAGEPAAGEGAAPRPLTPEAPAAEPEAPAAEPEAPAEPVAAQPAVETPPAPVAETPAEVAAPAVEPVAPGTAVEPAASALASEQFPRVDAIASFPMGPGGSIKPKVIAEGSPLYRETNFDGLNDLLRDDNQYNYSALFVTDNPDIALGQGKNTGVLLTFRPNALSGEINRKPGTGDLAGREYRTDIIAPKAVLSIVFNKTPKKNELRGLTTRILNKEFERQDLPDGRVQFVRKGFELPTPTPKTQPAPDLPALKAQRDALLLPNGKRPAPKTKAGKAFDALDAQIKALEPAPAAEGTAPAAKVAAPVVEKPKRAEQPAPPAPAAKPETKKAASKIKKRSPADEVAGQITFLLDLPEVTKDDVRAVAQSMVDEKLITENEFKSKERVLGDTAKPNRKALEEVLKDLQDSLNVTKMLGGKLYQLVPKAGQDLIDNAVSEVKTLPDTVYKGRAFSDTDRALLEKGSPNAVLDSLIASEKNPALRQVLRRIRALNLKTKIQIAPISTEAEGSLGIPARGMYDPATDTIYLDPKYGMNSHTFVHEMVHAAISKVLDNRSHPLTKAFEKFFLSVQGRLGMAYGAQDMQEFAAELVSNPSFQALLKSIKTPKSESLFRHILRSIAEFFGFSPKSNAFNQGLDFINDIIDISGGMKPTSMEKLFLGNGDLSIVAKVGKAMPALTGETVENTRNYLSNLSPKLLRVALGLLRLDNIHTLYKKELPSIKALMDAIEQRAGNQERQIAQTQKKYKEMIAVERKYSAQMQRMSDIAVDARLEEVDILDPDFKPAPDKVAAYTRLKNQFQSLPKPVQDVYRTIRDDYDKAFYRHRQILINAAETSESLAAKLRDKFKLEKPLVSYVPFLRSGDFWVSYVDPETGDPAAYAFESLREREQFIKLLDQKKIAYKAYQNLDDIRYTSESIPQSSFVYKVMQELRGQGAADAHLDAVWQSYLATFPSGSIMKQFMKSKNVQGMERDIIRGYGDVMIRWARKLANAEYGPKVDSALYKIREEARAQSDPAVNAAADNVLGQAQFLHNPTFSGLTTAATTASYFMFMAGNISSALINTLSLPMMVWPKLVGDFNWDAATRASLAAGRTAMNDWSKNPKYKKLHETLTDHAQLEHTQAREVLEGRRQKTSDFSGLKAKVLDGLSIPLAVTEKYNRAVTAIAAYDLMKGKGASDEDAVQYALQTVKDLHTSGMSATGPRWMQNALGRVFFTFKSFVWNQAFVTARAFHQAFKGAKPEDRKAAQRQLLAMYGMAFAFAGMRGMPFYGAVSTMAQMINALFGDEDEPFDFDQFMKDATNDFLFKGAFNYATNLEVATRAGVASDLLFRDDPRFIAEHGYMLFALTQALGPASSLIMNAGRGYEQFQDGEIERALETVSPSWLRNGLKGGRYLVEGATTLKGDPVMEDIGVYNSLMQMVGFSPADLADRYERLQAAKGFERELGARRTNILRLYDMARQAGDTELLAEARERITKFNETNPALRITQSTLDRSLRARLAAEKEMINGVRFNKNLRPIIEERFFSEDED